MEGKSSENIYVAVTEALRKKERGDETQFTTKNWWKLVWVVPVISFCKISFPVMRLIPYYCLNWPFLPSNHLTLRIRLAWRERVLIYFFWEWDQSFFIKVQNHLTLVCTMVPMRVLVHPRHYFYIDGHIGEVGLLTPS